MGPSYSGDPEDGTTSRTHENCGYVPGDSERDGTKHSCPSPWLCVSAEALCPHRQTSSPGDIQGKGLFQVSDKEYTSGGFRHTNIAEVLQ